METDIIFFLTMVNSCIDYYRHIVFGMELFDIKVKFDHERVTSFSIISAYKNIESNR